MHNFHLFVCMDFDVQVQRSKFDAYLVLFPSKWYFLHGSCVSNQTNLLNFSSIGIHLLDFSFLIDIGVHLFDTNAFYTCP